MTLKRILKKTKHRYLLIGGANTGKTSLLLASKLNFILKEANIHQKAQPEAWWATQQAAFLDVPGRYLGNQLLKKRRPKITGLIVTVSIAELLKQDQAAYHQLALERLYQRLAELPRYITYSLPCYIVVTKCDLLPGFTEFFSESSVEEFNQVFSIAQLSSSQNDLYHTFLKQFNGMLQRLNQQLIWRMHQADQVDVCAGIKDFPLEMEKIKLPLFSFAKNCLNSSILRLNGIYFTSALPHPHFVKQLFHVELNQQPIFVNNQSYFYNRTFALIAVLTLTAGCLSAWSLNKEARQNLNDVHFIQQSFSHYQTKMAHTIPLQTRLLALNTLLNALSQHQDSSPIQQFYQRSLQTLLMPEIKNYLEDFLHDPINKNLDWVYAALTSYLMLGNKNHFQAAFVLHTISKILPSKMLEKDKLSLLRHVHLALSQLPPSRIFVLNTVVIKETRDFLSSLTGFQLGYLVLKNMIIEQVPIEKYFSVIDPKQSVFIVSTNQRLPQIFTGPLFNTMFSQGAKTAAEEAIVGNWILGDDFKAAANPEIVSGLMQQLQNIYVDHYIEKWKSLLTYLQLRPTHQLAEIDHLIANMIGPTSPLLAFLKFVHHHTAPLSASTAESPFQALNNLMMEGAHSPILAQVFAALFSLHQALQTVLSAGDQRKAAYDFMSKKMQHNEIDVFIDMRLAANKSPLPIKTWLFEIANEAWRLLAVEANAYIDFSLHHTVNHFPLILKEGNTYVENGKNNLSRR